MGELLTIFAGGGVLPRRVADFALATGRSVLVIGLRGHVDPATLAGLPHEVVRIGAAARFRELIAEHGIRDVVMAGSVRRPSLLELAPDAEMRRLLARIGRDALRGDDGFLAAIIRVLTQEGLRIVGAHEIMGGALAPAGTLTQVGPDDQARSDIERGVQVARALGGVDVGQGCVVQEGLVLAVEAIEGTDAMLDRAGAMRRPGVGGVLIKIVKPAQERRVDLPSLGPETIAAAARAGLRGIAYEAGGALLLDRQATVAAANAAGLFLHGLSPAMVRVDQSPGETVP